MAGKSSKSRGRIGKFDYIGMQDEKGFTLYKFEGDIKRVLTSLLPDNSVPVLNSNDIGVYQIKNTAVSIYVRGAAESPQTCLKIHHEFSINRKDTLRTLEMAFK